MSLPPLLTPEGAEALAAASAEADPASLAAATRLRRRFAPDLAAAASAQVVLRRKAAKKLGPAAEQLWLTEDGLQQATRPVVSAWRAERFAELGVTNVLDLGCGVGADALALVAAGLRVTAVELDELTAAYARANLAGRAEVIIGDATLLAPTLLADADPTTGVFLDPARRTSAGRTWRVADFTPPWGFVTGLAASGPTACVKLGPGVPTELLPEQAQTVFIGDGPDVVEASLWQGSGIEPGRSALLLPAGDILRRPAEPRRLDVRAPGRYLLEPHGAVIRAGALGEIAPDADLWLLADGVAYLGADEPVRTPFAVTFEVTEVLDHSEKALRAWVREHRVGTLEIKTRGIDLDPAALRRRLQPKGDASATVIIARTTLGARTLVAHRLAK